MPKTNQKMLVTSALPYANGPIHLGHLVEYIQTDIWVRYQRLQGYEVYYVCADDAHGTPIMLRAQNKGISPQQLIERIAREHQDDFAEFLVEFDQYHSTHSEENRQLSAETYLRLRDAGHIEKRTIKQAYDAKADMFLPDRFIKGTCPNCKTEDQYGDNCEACGATYASNELIDPRSVITDTVPIEKDSEQLFFKLANFQDMLRKWINSEQHVQPEIANKLNEWFEIGLQDWDISRNAPYWGFEIPDAPGKFFYVWLDAPIGYMASFTKLCERLGLDFNEFWGADSNAGLYHFIGKDIARFHALFWPAVLQGAGYRTPTAVYCHGFLTVDGAKMSKSRGTFIRARSYLNHLNPEYLRYYYAAKLSNGVEDIDLNLEDFIARVNSDLVGKVVNIASRCAGFITSKFDGRLATTLPDSDLYQDCVDAGEKISQHYQQRQFGHAMRDIMALADLANQYIDQHKPWVLAKNESTADQVQAVCSQGINLFRVLVTYLKPVLPVTAQRAADFLNIEINDWQQIATPLTDHVINKFTPLLTRIEAESIAAIIEDNKQEYTEVMTEPALTGPLADDPISDEIDFDTFSKLDLRVAKIIEAEHVEGADKLLQLTLDLDGVQKQVFAGIKSAYKPEDLTGRLTIMVANLAPRKMRFGLSEGMVLAAGPGGSKLFILSPDDGAKPGMRVK